MGGVNHYLNLKSTQTSLSAFHNINGARQENLSGPVNFLMVKKKDIDKIKNLNYNSSIQREYIIKTISYSQRNLLVAMQRRETFNG